MNKLIKMQDYVLEMKNIGDWTFRDQAIKYAQLLKSKPKLSMFVACDDDGNVLEEPHNLGLIHLYPTKNPIMDMQLEHAINYKTALDKVIFDGWSVTDSSEDYVCLTRLRDNMFHDKLFIFKIADKPALYNWDSIHTISDLTPYNLTLKNKS